MTDVGGKGLSLIQMSGWELPVPPGFVLPSQFFEEWFSTLKVSSEWKKFVKASAENLSQACASLKERAYQLSFSNEQTRLLVEALERFPQDSLFAVRSSSPEEDLEGSSFAGGYETILGVTKMRIEEAVKRAFASCLDYRVVVYKKEHGFDHHVPKIAVVVQQQIRSDVAGVGFSLNPLTNNFDEAVFNANWGLGESVVSGAATPDTFVADKLTLKVVSSSVGKKETSVWLKKDGGTEVRSDERRDQLCLSQAEVRELTRMIIRLEKQFEKPVDIEFAFSEGALYLLQARPITSYVPVIPELLTPPGARKRLYLDASISAQGLHKPLSVMGTSMLRRAMETMAPRIYGFDFTSNLDMTPAIVRSGRLYLVVSNVLPIAGKSKFVNLFANIDPLAAKTLAMLDETPYLPDRPLLKRNLWRLGLKMPPMFARIVACRVNPDKAHINCQDAIAQFKLDLRRIERRDLPFHDFVNACYRRLGNLLINAVIPTLGAGRLALERMKKLLKAQGVSDADLKRLEQAMPHNVTVEMGLDLYNMSQMLDRSMAIDQLEDALAKGSLPAEFLDAWRRFIDRYGHRGPGELDIANPRYRDKPRLLLEQILTLKMSSSPENNPLEKYEKKRLEREATYLAVKERLSELRLIDVFRFDAVYRTWSKLGGYRETPKYLVIFMMDQIRQRLIREGHALHRVGRLSSPERIFDLTLEDLEVGLFDQKMDLEALAAKNRVMPDRLRRVPQLPTIFDSRGLILKPPPAEVKEGEIAAIPISAGVARGPVKALHSPDEKPLNRGDVLVARATDPGWTPLFVNAAAVVLEVGGLLQHGALVAREYGLPCVAGVVNATSIWKDGTIIEVDGSSGIIREVAG